ncbi:ent-kaurenoic acid hydroxylase 2 [Striga asiatica]|uniref:Ent-kaurenoic acid hydroxylase 2 n=1 Tax=Striga asiatica TaxID=4170 RepID=A0A5A7Q2B5_STRAF|nr:ent-kaurenoic acid hydroxylase 2 [Striga asiatica]
MESGFPNAEDWVKELNLSLEVISNIIYANIRAPTEDLWSHIPLVDLMGNIRISYPKVGNSGCLLRIASKESRQRRLLSVVRSNFLRNGRTGVFQIMIWASRCVLNNRRKRKPNERSEVPIANSIFFKPRLRQQAEDGALAKKLALQHTPREGNFAAWPKKLIFSMIRGRGRVGDARLKGEGTMGI